MQAELPEHVVNARKSNLRRGLTFAVLGIAMAVGGIWMLYQSMTHQPVPIEMTQKMSSQCKQHGLHSGLLPTSTSVDRVVFKERKRMADSGRQLILAASYTSEACDAYRIEDFCLGQGCDGDNTLKMVLTSRLPQEEAE